MSRTALLLEPDDAARALIRRVIASEGLRVIAGRALDDIRAEGGIDVAIVDELAGNGAILDEVRRVQRRHPGVPLVVTGTFMPIPILIEVLRLGAIDVLPKPFTPAELRAALGRVVARAGAGHDRAVAFAASIAEAREAIARGAPAAAKPALADARAASPFDAEAMALEALVAELEGRDDDADRGYRAALALRREEDTPAPDPTDGLARLALYQGARPAALLPPQFVDAAARIVIDPSDGVRADDASDASRGARVTVFLLGVSLDARSVYFRVDERRAFALLGAAARPEAIASALTLSGVGRLSFSASATSSLDLDRIERLRAPRAATNRTAES